MLMLNSYFDDEEQQAEEAEEAEENEESDMEKSSKEFHADGD